MSSRCEILRYTFNEAQSSLHSHHRLPLLVLIGSTSAPPFYPPVPPCFLRSSSDWIEEA